MIITLIFQLFINLIRMGNSTNPQQFNPTSEQQYPLSKTTTNFNRFAVYADNQVSQFIGREIELPQSGGKTILLAELQEKKRKNVESVLPILKQYFRKNSTVCSQQQRCLLLSKKPQYTLLELMRRRKVAGNSFRVSEISTVIKRVVIALKSEKEDNIVSLDLQSIVYLQGQVYVIDPLMQGADAFGYNLKGLYPPPQSFSQYYQYDEDIRQIDSQFFCLGMIALSMISLQERIDQIYQKNTSIGFTRLFNQEKLKELISKVRNQKLKLKIQVLTALNTKTRKNIINIIKNQQRENQQKNFDRQNQKANSDIFDQNLQNSRVAENSRVIIQKLMPLESSRINIPIQRKPLKQMVNISFSFSNNNTLNHNPSLTKLQTAEPQIIIHSPKHQPPSNASNKFQPEIKQPNKTIVDQHMLKVQKSIETPPKNKTKNHFSTIKQVSEYQECFTQGNITEFQSKCSEKKLEGRYQGNTVNGLKQGFGKYYYAQGGRYEGEWKQDRMNGFAKLYYPSGMLAFQGNMVNDQFHGSGRAYNNSYVVLQSGVNFQDFSNLDEIWVTYEGQFYHDFKHGWGIMTFGNDQRFQGHFANDMMEGYGTFYSPRKGIVIGIWKMSKLQRTGTEAL